jgi:hypothetical protein
MGTDAIVVIAMVCLAGIALVWLNSASKRTADPPKADQEQEKGNISQEEARTKRGRR